MAEYTAEDIYSTKRAEIQTKIRALAESMLGEKMFAVPNAGESRAPARLSLGAPQISIDNGKRRRHCFKRLPFGRYAEARGD
jgi:hypothetical protein